jgi:hypothetical protein
MIIGFIQDLFCTVPSAGSLYEEAQALLLGGADTTGTTLMHGSFQVDVAHSI